MFFFENLVIAILERCAKKSFISYEKNMTKNKPTFAVSELDNKRH